LEAENIKILLIEDEVSLSDALLYILKKNNYTVDTSYDGLNGEEMAETGDYDIIVLDRMLPGKEGLEVLKSLRKKNVFTPVLFLTAKDSIKDRIQGLDSGADDYLVKPFSKEEFLARIRVVIRRKSEIIHNDVYNINGVSFTPLKGELCFKGTTIKLTSKESQILEILMINRNNVISKGIFMDKIWGFNAFIELNNIEVYISYLRKKLSSFGCGLKIETIRGSGYLLKEV
jgi:DNA-binding response OmpR family regulator